MSTHVEVTLALIEKIRAAVDQAAKTASEALQADVNEKTAHRNLQEFCTSVVDQTCGNLDKETAANICIE